MQDKKPVMEIKEVEKKVYPLLQIILEETIKKEQEKQRKKRAELAKHILIAMSVGLILPASLILPNLPLVLRPLLKNMAQKYRTRPKDFLKSIRYLKNQELITVRELDDKQEIILSDKGKKRVLLYAIDHLKLPVAEKWDGQWKFIIFDIPIRLNQGRAAFQETLKNLGCYQIQKSVYAYPYPCKDEIDFIAALFEVYPYIIYTEVSHLENDSPIRAYFNL